MISKSNLLVSIVILVVFVLCAIFWTFGGDVPQAPDRPEKFIPANTPDARDPASSRLSEVAMENLAPETRPAQKIARARAAGPTLEAEFNLVVAGGVGIGEFIREHEKLAQKGNVDSMHFLAEAMKDCTLSMTMVQPLIDRFELERGELVANREDYLEYLRQSGPGNSAFAIQEWNNRIERAYDCFGIDENTETLNRESSAWEAIALEKGQSNAVATSVTSDLHNKTAEELAVAKSRIRSVLVSNKTLETVLAAQTLSSFSTGRHGIVERAAWALLACEFYDCESTLSYRYRTTCEVDATYGEIYCVPGMTDSEFIRAKVPGSYDIARGRAMELKQYFDQERWAQIGL